MKVGRAIEAGLRADIKDVTPPELPAAEMVVGIDSCFVKGISRKRKTSLEIVLGRIAAKNACRNAVLPAARENLSARICSRAFRRDNARSIAGGIIREVVIGIVPR